MRSGEAYFIRPGHQPVYVENTETLEFSPHDELEKVMEVVARTIQAAEPEKTGTQNEADRGAGRGPRSRPISGALRCRLAR